MNDEQLQKVIDFIQRILDYQNTPDPSLYSKRTYTKLIVKGFLTRRRKGIVKGQWTVLTHA